MLARYPASAEPAVNQSPPDVWDAGRLGSNAGGRNQGFLQPSVGSGPDVGGGPKSKGYSDEKYV